MKTRTSFLIFSLFLFGHVHAGFAQNLSDDPAWIRLSDQVAESILRTNALAVYGQVYGEVFIAQDLLLGFARGFDFGDM
jgi:hypothetical protein